MDDGVPGVAHCALRWALTANAVRNSSAYGEALGAALVVLDAALESRYRVLHAPMAGVLT